MTFSSKKTRAVALRNYFSPFGNKLVQSGYIGADQMQQALVETRKSGRSLYFARLQLAFFTQGQ